MRPSIALTWLTAVVLTSRSAIGQRRGGSDHDGGDARSRQPVWPARTGASAIPPLFAVGSILIP